MLSKAERETTFRFDEEKGRVQIFTASPPIKRKLERRGLTPCRISTIQGIPTGWFYETPYRTLRWTISLSKPLRTPMSLEARQAVGERLQASRSKAKARFSKWV